jgi:hypothetical protein
MSADIKILRHLAVHGPSFGLDLVIAGAATRGLVYVYLDQMEDDGLVDSWVPEDQDLADGQTPRRKYRITAFGAQGHSRPLAQ